MKWNPKQYSQHLGSLSALSTLRQLNPSVSLESLSAASLLSAALLSVTDRNFAVAGQLLMKKYADAPTTIVNKPEGVKRQSQLVIQKWVSCCISHRPSSRKI